MMITSQTYILQTYKKLRRTDGQTLLEDSSRVKKQQTFIQKRTSTTTPAIVCITVLIFSEFRTKRLTLSVK